MISAALHRRSPTLHVEGMEWNGDLDGYLVAFHGDGDGRVFHVNIGVRCRYTAL